MSGPAYHGRTHLPGGTDPIPGFGELIDTGGEGLEDVILSKNPVGLWKMDESSGNTATDSSGNGNDMTVPAGGYITATWAQAAGPPGTQTALSTFEPGSANTGTRFTASLTAYTDNFSAGLWVNLAVDTNFQELLGQGSPPHINAGWGLYWDNGPEKFAVFYGTAGANIAANAVSVIDTWYLVGLTRDAGTMTLYVDGAAQSATTATALSTATPVAWIANDGHFSDATHGSNARLSWAFITDTPLSGADWLEIYETGQTGGALAQGLVWTANGSGGASWAAPTIEVTY